MTDEQLALLIAALYTMQRGEPLDNTGPAEVYQEQARAFIANGRQALPVILTREAARAEAVAAAATLASAEGTKP